MNQNVCMVASVDTDLIRCNSTSFMKQEIKEMLKCGMCQKIAIEGVECYICQINYCSVCFRNNQQRERQTLACGHEGYRPSLNKEKMAMLGKIKIQCAKCKINIDYNSYISGRHFYIECNHNRFQCDCQMRVTKNEIQLQHQGHSVFCPICNEYYPTNENIFLDHIVHCFSANSVAQAGQPQHMELNSQTPTPQATDQKPQIPEQKQQQPKAMRALETITCPKCLKEVNVEEFDLHTEFHNYKKEMQATIEDKEAQIQNLNEIIQDLKKQNEVQKADFQREKLILENQLNERDEMEVIQNVVNNVEEVKECHVIDLEETPFRNEHESPAPCIVQVPLGP